MSVVRDSGFCGGKNIIIIIISNKIIRMLISIVIMLLSIFICIASVPLTVLGALHFIQNKYIFIL